MDVSRNVSLMDHFFNMLRLSNIPTVPSGDDENATDADEPPDDQLTELSQQFQKENVYTRSNQIPKQLRRESLLTRAIQAGSEVSPTSPRTPENLRGMSTASSHSFASTAELTSDGDSPARSASPSPPPPATRIPLVSSKQAPQPGKVMIAPVTKDDKPDVAEIGEAAVEKTLGRKRCIMFACSNNPSDASKEISPAPAAAETPEKKPEPAPRKCRLTFACPTRQDSASDTGLLAQAPPAKKPDHPRSSKERSPLRQSTSQSAPEKPEIEVTPVSPANETEAKSNHTTPLSPLSPKHAFHEFASSHEETEDWVEAANELHKPKLTMDDCLKKENAIRRIGKEAEEEAEAEEREQEELENELEDDNDGEDDFAPSDDDESDGGNESDDEGGFADSDDESDAGSDYQFWAPSTTTAATSTDNVPHFFRQRHHSVASSASSSHSDSIGNQPGPPRGNRRPSKLAAKMRPGTPELPDSTDFVCGTLDEDRPLEAAYISCREQKRREKHVLIPQDIDPSFPTTDPEDEEEDEEEQNQVAESSDNLWFKDQFVDFDDETRGRRKPSAFRVSPLHSPAPLIAPPRQNGLLAKKTRGTNRSPPPKHHVARSPPPKRLFDHPPKRLRSPAPAARLRSPRGSPTNLKLPPLGITINRLAQRPKTDRTSSLPHTPNPFFRNWRNGSPAISRIPSAAVSPGFAETRQDLHVRGPVDIVIGLEKKRQKRKEKFWRQHCRKAKEQAEKRPPPGRGVERMKELGLECAERTRGYGLGQQAQLVLSL